MFLNSAIKILVRRNKTNVSTINFVRALNSSSLNRNVSYQEQYYSSNRKSLRIKFLTYTAVTGALTGYLSDDWNKHKFEFLTYLFPSVYAKRDIKDYRKQFNFIADIVEHTSNGVVNLEVFDKRLIDPITGKPFAVGGGSGVIVDKDGLILTNAHIVHKSNIRIVVRLYNGDVTEGIVEAIDERGDLATIRIDRKNLPTMKMGDSDDLRPGEFVVAMGSPLALVNSITSGVVSNPGRHSYELKLYDVNMTYIQTDASVTFGNSGGPLVNLNGEVIGINVLKFTPGISFAIPINYVKQFLQNIQEARKGNYFEGLRVLLQDGNKKRKMLGITMLSLTPDLLHQLREHGTVIPRTVNHGVLIWKVIRGSPADIEGLKAGDIITHINEIAAVSTSDIFKLLDTNEYLYIKVIRDGKEMNFKVKPK